MVSLGHRPEREVQCVQFRGGGFIPIPRCASTSILRSLWTKYPGTSQDYRTADTLTGHVVAMLRHPTERLWSVYLHQRRPSRGALTPWEPGSFWHPDPRLPWAEWIEALVVEGKDQEWSGYILPQTWFFKGREVDLVPWDFLAVAEKLDVQLGHENKSQLGLPMPDITVEMDYNLQTIYWQDYDLWESVTPLK